MLQFFINLPQIPPAAPSGLSAVAASSSQINLSWTDNSSGVAHFSVEESPDGSTWSVIKSLAPGTTTLGVTSLTASTKYYFRIRGYVIISGSLIYSTYTSSVNATTQSGSAAVPADLILLML